MLTDHLFSLHAHRSPYSTPHSERWPFPEAFSFGCSPSIRWSRGPLFRDIYRTREKEVRVGSVHFLNIPRQPHGDAALGCRMGNVKAFCGRFVIFTYRVLKYDSISTQYEGVLGSTGVQSYIVFVLLVDERQAYMAGLCRYVLHCTALYASPVTPHC